MEIMTLIKYWIWALTNAETEVVWHWKEWRLSYDYSWYDGPHRSIWIGPVSFYINA